MELQESQILLNLIRLGAITPNNHAVGGGHFWVYTKQGPLDCILEDLTLDHSEGRN